MGHLHGEKSKQRKCKTSPSRLEARTESVTSATTQTITGYDPVVSLRQRLLQYDNRDIKVF